MEQLTKAQFNACRREFIELGEKALYLNHYQLAAETHIKDPIIWKVFLTDPQIADYVSSEMNLIRTAAINEIIHKAPNSKSVGQAQLINSLIKIDEAVSNKTGPVFIYTYVPLNEEQKFAPNVMLQPMNQITEEPEKQEEILDGIEISTEIPK
ncbi:MAG: hypothetical protein J6Z28_07365 [Succinivibrio sp.]|nr:hypothetical protein [Succinivibrio sp.]